MTDPTSLLPPGTPVRVLDPEGNLTGSVADLGLTPGDLVGMYRDMIRTRTFDTMAVALQRQGQLGVWASCKGQEGAQIGIAWAMGLRDWAFPSYREHGITTVRGVPFSDLLLQYKGVWMGHYDPAEYQVAPHSIPIATHLLHAVGYAHAAQLSGDDLVTLAFIGDGGTSEGDFHEALNFAAVWNTPTVFVVQNNEFAISTPTEHQTVAPSIAHKGVGYGVKGYRVDGNDVLATFHVAAEAIERARGGGGPALIEAHTYRMQPHTTADDDTRYRSPDELAEWEPKDPVRRVERFLLDEGILYEPDLRRIAEEADEEAIAIRAVVVAAGPVEMSEVFEHVYVDPSVDLIRQAAAFGAEAAE